MSTRAGATEGAFWGDADDGVALRRYQTLVNTIDDGIYQLDAEGRFVAVNDVIVETTGYSRDELVGEHVSLVLGGDDIERIEREIVSQIESDDDTITTFELTIRTADGETTPCELRVNLLIEDGAFQGTIGVARDISEEKRQRETLESAQASYDSIASVLDESDIGVFILDDEFEVAWVNEPIGEYFGLDQDELVGRDKRRVVNEIIGGRVDEQNVFADRVLATYDDNSYIEQFECRITAGDGREARWLEHYSKPIESGLYAGGRIEFYYDITERKRSEDSLQETEKRFQTLVDAVEEYAIFRLDPNGHVVSWNEGAREIKDYDREEILGEHFSVFYTDEARANGVPTENLSDAAREGSIEDTEWRVRADGSRFWANVTLTAIRNDDGDLEGYVKITRDMTERRERERQLRRERDLNEQIIETAPVRIVVFGADGTIDRMNSQARGELPFDPTIGRTLDAIALFDANGDPLGKENYPAQQVIETGEPISNEVVQHETTSGERKWSSITASPLFDAEGNLERVIVAGRDITELKEKERQIERQRDDLKQELNEVFTRIDDAVHGLDEEWRFTYLNDSTEELLGMSEEELLGRYVWDVFPNAAERSYKDRYERAMDTQEPVVFEEYSNAADGWLEVAVYPSDSGLSVYFRDVTERRDRQRELERYEQLVETVWDGVYALDENDHFVLVNDAFCEIVGYERDELLGEHPTLVNSREVNEAANEIETEIVTGERDIGILEYEFERSDGELVPVETRFGPIEYDDGSVGRCGVARDISRRKEYERELESRARQQEVVSELGQFALENQDLDELFAEAARSVAETLDTDYCKVLDLDADAEKLLLRQGVGWQEGVVGTATVSAVETDSQASYMLQSERPVVVEDLETESRFSGPELLASHDVKSGISTVIGSVDEPWGILGAHDTEARSFTDEDVDFVQSVANILAEAIERQKYQNELQELVEKLEDSNARLQQFAYVASHDLQEPLRMVSSYLQLLEQRYADELDADGEEFIEFAVDGAERMRGMIDGLLEYSRVETQGESFEPVDLDNVFEEVRADLQVRINETDAGITTDDLPRVKGDASQLRQVFQNLLSNAIDYSGDESPRIDVSKERDGDDWIISVRDEGVGIDPEDTDRIFDVFQRLHTHEEHPGTGIGLALCQRIVERHGGDIWVDSEPDEGSTFSFRLPALQGSAAADDSVHT